MTRAPGTAILVLAATVFSCSGEVADPPPRSTEFPPPTGTSFTFDSDFKCAPRPADATGFLQPICQYLVDNFKSYNVNPNGLQIKRILKGSDQTRFGESEYANDNYRFVEVSCCYTGDWAVVDVRTNKVVDFSLGAI